MTAASTQPTSIPPIPTDLPQLLHSPKTPWLISPALFDRIKTQFKTDNEAGKPFSAVAVTNKDPEHAFVFRYFQHQKPPHYCIKNILCIHNPDQTKAFEGSMRGIEEAANTFAPAWSQEEPKAQRAKTIDRWKTSVAPFSPFQISSVKRVDKFTQTKIIPLWHGSKHVDSICKIGFTFFGKHHFFESNAKAGPQASTDIGYFGSGIYFTNSANYASMYNSGTLVVSWVSMREPYPVVNDVPIPRKGRDMLNLQGKGAYQNYNAHYIPVTSIDPSDSENMVYHPCHHTEKPAWDEYVVFASTQALPRFIIELAVDFPVAVSNSAHAIDLEALKKIDDDGNNALHRAAIAGDANLCKTILASNLNILATNKHSYNALHLAVIGGKLEAVKILANNHKLLQMRAAYEYTSLMLCTYYPKHEDVFKALLSAGADPFETQNGHNVLHLTTERGNHEIVKILAANKKLLDTPNIDGHTPLMIGAKQGHASICKTLLEEGANLKQTNSQNQTALQIARENSKYNVVKVFETHLKSGSEFNSAAKIYSSIVPVVPSNTPPTATYKPELLKKTNHEETCELNIAAADGDTERCKTLLAAGANPTATDSLGYSAIHVAAFLGKHEVIKILATNKQLLELRGSHGYTPLLLGAWQGFPNICKILLEAGADPKTTNNEGSNALHCSASNNKHETAKILATNRQLIDAKDINGNTSLIISASKGYLEICMTLLSAGADPSITNYQGRNALHAAAADGKHEVVKILATNKKLIDAKDNNGYTPLLLGASQGFPDVCKILLKAGADPSATNHEGKNALKIVLANKKLELIPVLGVHKQLLESSDENGISPLSSVVDDVELFKALLSVGADPKATNKRGQNALLLAAYSGAIEIVIILAANKLLLEMKDVGGYTPLMIASWYGRSDVCKVLLAAGADPKTTNNEGHNALHCSVSNNKHETAMILATNRQLIDAKDTHGNTSLIISASKGYLEICTTLLSAGADPSITNSQGCNALHAAAADGKHEVVKILATNKKLIDAKDNNGYTPLMLGATEGYPEVCQALLEAQADPQITNKWLVGQNALQLATAKGKTEVIKIFEAHLKKSK